MPLRILTNTGNAATLVAGFVLLLLVSQVSADDRFSEAEKLEQARQAAFSNGMTAIAETMAMSDFSLLVDAIDRDDMVERIFALRLIDPRIKKSFSEDLDRTFAGIVEGSFVFGKEPPGIRLLALESRGNQGRAVMRLDQPNLQFNYIEFELALDTDNELVVVDWTDHAYAQRFSDGVGKALLMQAPSNAATRKLMQLSTASEREVFQFAELLKAARDQQLDRYLEIRDNLPPRVRELRVVAELTVSLTKHLRKRRQMVAALKELHERFPNEPRYTLMLLDYFFPQRKYEEAIASLEGFYRLIGADDAASEARLSAAHLVNGDLPTATQYAERAIELEPDLELGWWSLLGARVQSEDFAGAVEALTRLEDEFGYSLGPDALQRDRSYRPLLASSEYQDWREGR